MITNTNGIILKDTLDHFLVLSSRPGNARIVLYCINHFDTLTLGYHDFSVVSLPEPQIFLNQKPISNPVTLDKNEFYTSDSIGVYITDDIPGSMEWFKIKSFTISYTYGGFHVSHTNESNIISEKTRQLIRSLRPDYAISVKFIVDAGGRITKPLPIYRINIY